MSDKETLNITPFLKRFRLASRGLFNNHFLPPIPDDLIDYVEFDDDWRAFHVVENELFQALVSKPLKLVETEYGSLNPQISVVVNGEWAPILINREARKDHGHWDYPVTKVAPECRMSFISFFDFDPSDFADGRYAMVNIDECPSNPAITGRHALIETQYVAFFIVKSH